jgi:hypothetical protein
MSNLPSRRTREQRAFQLVVVSGVSGTVAAVGLLLAVFGVVGAGIPLLAAIVAVISFLMFRRTVT